MFTYGDAPNPLKMYCGKDCDEKFEGVMKDEKNWLFAIFQQHPMAELPDVLQRENEATEITRRIEN